MNISRWATAVAALMLLSTIANGAAVAEARSKGEVSSSARPSPSPSSSSSLLFDTALPALEQCAPWAAAHRFGSDEPPSEACVRRLANLRGAIDTDAPDKRGADVLRPYAFTPSFGGATVPAPLHSGLPLPDDSTTTFAGACFDRIEVTTQWFQPINMRINITATRPRASALAKHPICVEAVQLWSVGLGFKMYWFVADAATSAGGKNTSWAMSSEGHNFSPSQQWYDRNRGLQVFFVPVQPVEFGLSLLATGALLGTFGDATMTAPAADINVNFMHRYVQADTRRMGPTIGRRRSSSSPAPLVPFVDVFPGDALVVLRLDGLDPTLAWTMGFTAAHTAVVLGSEDNDGDGDTTALRVCEANVASAFWPTDGVQCTGWDRWLRQAEDAGLNVALVPLNASRRAAFNASAAAAFVSGTLGLSYGFPTLLTSWLDTVHDNYPCAPTDNATDTVGAICETEALEVLKAVELDKQLGASTKNVYRQAMQRRAEEVLGQPMGSMGNASVVDSLAAVGAATNGTMTFGALMQMPERDSYVYEQENVTTRGRVHGPSMVCSVFVCRVWKAAGVYAPDVADEAFDCGEMTPWSLFSHALFDAGRMGPNRPASCQEADPAARLCQLCGNWTAGSPAPGFNTRPLFPRMDDRCPSRWPGYERSERC